MLTLIGKILQLIKAGMVSWSMNRQLLSDWLPYVIYEQIVKNKLAALLDITSAHHTYATTVVENNRLVTVVHHMV